MFSVFGYGYIRFDLLDSVREQIHNPDQRSSVLNGVINSSPGPEATTLSVLCTPCELRSFFINFDISSDSVKRYVAVLLPGLESGGGRIYERVLSHAALRANLRHVPIPSDQSLLTDLQRKDEALKIWRLACLDSG
jgi:hypothetical protein